MKRPTTTIHIGKNGLTEGFIHGLKNAFKDRKDVKISILKSATYERENIKIIAKKISDILGKKYTFRIVGFAIFLKKWRKSR